MDAFESSNGLWVGVMGARQEENPHRTVSHADLWSLNNHVLQRV